MDLGKGPDTHGVYGDGDDNLSTFWPSDEGIPNDLFVVMPKIESLRLHGVTSSDAFLRPPVILEAAYRLLGSSTSKTHLIQRLYAL